MCWFSSSIQETRLFQRQFRGKSSSRERRWWRCTERSCETRSTLIKQRPLSRSNCQVTNASPHLEIREWLKWIEHQSSNNWGKELSFCVHGFIASLLIKAYIWEKMEHNNHLSFPPSISKSFDTSEWCWMFLTSDNDVKIFKKSSKRDPAKMSMSTHLKLSASIRRPG